MTRKLLVVGLVLAMLWAIAVPAYADGIGCQQNPITGGSHGTSYAQYVSTKDFYTYLSNSKHNRETYDYYICTFCEAAGYLSTWRIHTGTVTEAHNSQKGDSDGGHKGKTDQHYRNKKCSCGYEYKTTYKCPGNPCHILDRAHPELEIE